MPIYLCVPFKDKDRAKAAGARWDGVARQWIVPDGTDLSKFAEWVSHGSAQPTRPVAFHPMRMPEGKEEVARSICVAYDRESGFHAYCGASPLAGKDVWDACLGLPGGPREMEVFQARLRAFYTKTRSTDKIVSFLYEVLSSTWPVSLQQNPKETTPGYPCGNWESLIDYLATDLSNWITEHSYEREWDPTHGRWCVSDRRSDW